MPVDVVELGSRLETIVLRRLAEDRLVLPAMPSLVGKCMTLLQQSDGALKQVAVLVARDPVLSAQLVKAASGAAHGGAVRTVEQAVTRLGAQKVKTFLIETSARKLFDSRAPSIAEASRGLWVHSHAVALLARDVAALCGSAEGETAYLAGLLHDIGKPVLASILLEAERMLATTRPTAPWFKSDAWLGAIAGVHRRVGVALAEKWCLPDPVVAAIRDCGDFDPGDRLCAANFVRFANAAAKDKGLFVGPVDIDDARALVMVGRSMLGVDDDVLARLTNDLVARATALEG